MPPSEPAIVSVIVPDLGVAGRPVRFVGWLVPHRAHLIPGERIAELVVEGMDFHLEADVEGMLIERTAAPGDILNAGVVIGRIQATESED